MLFLYIIVALAFKHVASQDVIHYGMSEPSTIRKRDTDSTFKGHPKTREEKWHMAFSRGAADYDQIPSLISLVHMLTNKYLKECTPIILYDSMAENMDGLLLQQMMRTFPQPYVHGKISKDNAIADSKVLNTITSQCVSYILFLTDVMTSADVLGLQATTRVIVVARSSQWRVQEFLFDKSCRNFVNLLIIAQSFRDDKAMETPYILYTHSLFVDGLGASKPVVLTSWSKGKLARPQIDLFPPKMVNGYAGHRFSVMAANQPPFVFKKIFRDYLGNPKVSWEGVEFRLLNLLGHRNNFSIEIKEPETLSAGPGDSVLNEINSGHGDIGIGGMYVTSDRLLTVDMSVSHSQDCAAFISLTSTALPRYRAIMGPFHWTVWVALTVTYLVGIFPLAFSDKHTLRHLIHNSGEVENMFWYVFGTFTNCFTFVGKNSWGKTTKITTRLLIGWYWIFTIIITACYTGSIIAFVTLPIYPATVDTVDQLLSGHYRVGTLDRGGWEKWFANSSDSDTNKLMKHLELVPDIESGLRNTTKAFFWPYAFLGSKFQLEYVVQSNFSLESSKRSVLHISDKCFVPFGVSLSFPKQSVFQERLNRGILLMLQSGIVSKLIGDVKWKMQRSSSGKLLQISSGNTLRPAIADERGLSLGDTQGMFLLLGAGFLAAGFALMTEWMGGCGRMCKRRRAKSITSVTSISTISTVTSKSYIAPTPNSKTDAFDQIHSSKTSIQNIEEIKAIDEQSIINIVKCEENQIYDVVEKFNMRSDKIIDMESLKVCADIVYNGKEVNKGHSRRSSYVDWDSEINDLFQYTKSDLSVNDEIKNKDESNDIIESDEISDCKSDVEEIDVENQEDIQIETATEHHISQIFGERISPV